MTALIDPTKPARTGGLDRRRRTLVVTVLAVALLLAVVIAGTLLDGRAGVTHLTERKFGPSWDHPFGTDWLGRDLFARTLVGLRLSLFVGVSAAAVSAVIALVMAALAATCGSVVEAIVNWLVDLFLALPHLVLLILISFALGGGTRSVVIAIAVTHWPTLTRVLLAKARVIAASDYVGVSRSLGKGRGFITRHHVIPHLVPHFVVGAVLLFPHAILHEAALSFLGLGVDPGAPAVGILLADSMKYLSAGVWWMAVLPGLSLLILVKVFDTIGDSLRLLADPRSHHL